jgi:hypothetical protein
MTIFFIVVGVTTVVFRFFDLIDRIEGRRGA